MADHPNSTADTASSDDALSIEEVNDLTGQGFLELFGSVYEHAPWVMADAWRHRPFAHRDELYFASALAIDAAPRQERLDIVAGHPELARPDLNEGTLTASSQHEQKSAGLLDIASAAKEELNDLAEEYRARHGFPGVVCVREHTQTESIVREIRWRIGRSTRQEFRTSLDEVKKIARRRIHSRVLPPPDHGGYLTTHVLDTANGTPGAGLGYDVFAVRDGQSAPLCSGYTDSDGRSTGAVLSAGNFQPGEYRITFRVAEYYGDGFDRRYFHEVPLQFVVDRPEEHYHVPLIVSRWGFTTYRGS
ncbi:2-oxo-4-hydroxy-4-carboxy-5-ureidoimidazoline decarboxylase [Streptomyces sp. NPDC058045]|uniref:2-oxo-4-hydroxy-4-carboxy-5-ureidoimidazoline decarboxylase n=1 Tax=Streptomyces sp. NPDC058045 TaxID=3346311 RepID=UPI0036E82B6A